jgi:hypothetical protein
MSRQNSHNGAANIKGNLLTINQRFLQSESKMAVFASSNCFYIKLQNTPSKSQGALQLPVCNFKAEILKEGIYACL